MTSLSEEILEEVKFVSAAVSNFNNSAEVINSPQANKTLAAELAEKPHTNCINIDSSSSNSALTRDAIADLFAERREKMAKLRAEQNPYHAEYSGSNWRLIGSKRIWKYDWTEFDARKQLRLLQEKKEQKAKLRRKQRKRHQQQILNQGKLSSSNNSTNNIGRKNHIDGSMNKYNSSNNNTYSNKSSDRNLLAMAKTQFAGPPSSIEHPVAGLSINAAKSSFISFEKGETINPYRSNKLLQSNNPNANIDQQPKQSKPQRAPDSQAIEIPSLPPTRSTDNQFELDPMRPPIVRLTEQSVEGDGRFLKARLRDPKIMKVVRLYLAYMKDQPATVCVEGMTSTSIRMLLASEGLPTAPDHLHRIFADVHQEFGLDPATAAADLASYRQYLASERTHRLQQLRESTNKFYSSSQNFQN